jgi:squalene synthase HpnC
MAYSPTMKQTKDLRHRQNLKLAQSHYENFPVASVILPRRLRQPIAMIYRFARTADDIADEGHLSQAERHAQLQAIRTELQQIATGSTPASSMMQGLQQCIQQHGLDIQLLSDLLDAFTQDIDKQRYADFAELMQYCRKSANPIGRLLLQLNKAESAKNIGMSDAICSALQLINFLQDIAEDYARQRIYLPQDELKKFNVSEQQIAQQNIGGAWALMMEFQINRARRLLQAGAPLGLVLPGRMGFELRMVIAGGERILRKMHQHRGDVFRHRPQLNGIDWLIMLYRAARKK